MLSCSPVAFNDIKRLARSMPADGLEAQDVVPPRCGCWVAHMAIFVAAIGFWAKHKRSRAGPPRPAFPAFLAGAGRPLLPSMIDYSVFSCWLRRAGQLFPVPLAARPLLSISAFRAKFAPCFIWLMEVRGYVALSG